MPVTILMRGRTTPESREMGEPADADGPKGKWVGRFLDFFFLPAKAAQKRKENGMSDLFYKNMEIIFRFYHEFAIKKKKAT